MNKQKQNIIFCIIGFWLLQPLFLAAQSCDSNYFSFNYTTSEYVTYSKALAAPDFSILCLQTNKFYSHGLTKFTPQGNVIFSYEYTAPFAANSNHSWTELIFTDMAIASDSITYVTGSVTKHGLFFDNTESPPARTAAVICKINKYGNVIWSRFFANPTTDPLCFSNIITLQNGDVIGYLTTQVALPYYGRVVCLSSAGNIKWAVTLNTDIYSSGALPPSSKIAITQIKNGTIVIGNVVSHVDSLLTSREFHFMGLHPSDGSLAWETSYDYNQPLFIPNIVSVTELPNGKLSFQTTWNDNNLSTLLNIITDNTGTITKMTSTHTTNDFIIAIDAKQEDPSGNQSTLLTASDGNAVLLQTDADGKLLRSKKYGKLDGNNSPIGFVHVDNGYDIFLSDFSKSFRMLRTDPIGRLDCDSLPINLIQNEIPLFTGSNINNIHTKDSLGANQVSFYSGFFIVQNTVTISTEKNTSCQKDIPCCVDVVDTTNINQVALCEGGTFTLPDKTIVSDSGRYYVSYKTQKGCDSVSLFQIRVYKNPASLSLGSDTCFNGSNSVVLHATEGYNAYAWMNSLGTSSSTYTANKPGVYQVTVSNICGTKTDSVHVYQQCDFPILMPNAFTPNNDNLNDIFKVPSQNINRLIRLTIYNRWGEIVFQTTNKNKGWDGNINDNPQQSGLYIYHLQMQNLNGKMVSQKGTVMLIR